MMRTSDRNITKKIPVCIITYVVIFLAFALFVSGSSNMNCSYFPTASVDAGFTPILRTAYWNNSHAQSVDYSDYGWTIACKSNITTLDYGCTGVKTKEILQLYRDNDSHVSIDSVYSVPVCLNSTNLSIYINLSSSAIGATPEDFECMFSLANASNSHVYDCDYPGAALNWNIQVVPSVPPNGSITIFGENGTELTTSRNVLLNLSFSDDVCVSTCRYANEDSALLDAAPWENCTAVKSWILDEASGNKTVYYQIKDCEDSTNIFNDSIMLHYVADTTSPLAPIVYDSNYGYDIDWWNSNSTLSAYWWNATDDIGSIQYKYRIYENGTCYNNDCNWTDTGYETEVSLTGLTLNETCNYSFEILAYTNEIMNSTALSNGTIIDLTDPSFPVVNSTTHPDQTAAYVLNNVSFNFSSTDWASGVAGYSYVLDSHPGTAPDNELESRAKEIIRNAQNDGYYQMLRLNSSIASPHTYAVFDQLSINVTENDTLQIRAQLAEMGLDFDDEMTIDIYLVSVADGADINSFDYRSSAISDIVNITQDISYAENMLLANYYTANIIVNTTVYDTANDIYLVIAGNTTDNNNRNNLSIAGTRTSIDNTTKNFVCSNTDVCQENTSTIEYSIEVKRIDSGNSWDVWYTNIAQGIYYFHVKSKDNAGNWGDTTHYSINISRDGITPTITAPFSGQVFSSSDISVSVSVDSPANISVTALHDNTSNSTSSWVLVNTTYTFTVSLQEGTNTIYATAINPDNGVISRSENVYVRYSDYVPAAGKTLRVTYGSASCSGHLCSNTENSVLTVGIAIENDTAVLGADSITSDTGSHTFKIFATKAIADTTSIESDLDDDDFLDRRVPLFGYDKKVPYNIIQTEVRPVNIYFAGDRTVSAGTYTLVFRNVGSTQDGKTNITVSIV